LEKLQKQAIEFAESGTAKDWIKQQVAALRAGGVCEAAALRAVG
jgi:hypothetical protein